MNSLIGESVVRNVYQVGAIGRWWVVNFIGYKTVIKNLEVAVIDQEFSGKIFNHLRPECV